MRYLSRALPCVVLVVASQSSIGQTNELLVPLTKQEQATVQADLRSDIDAYGEIVRRGRLVKINPDLLAGNPDTIVISPFSDVSVSLTRSNFVASPDGTAWQWDGTYTDLPFSRDEFSSLQVANGVNPSTAERIYDEEFTTKIFGATYVVLAGSEHPQPKSARRFDKDSGRWISISDQQAATKEYDRSPDLSDEFVVVSADFSSYDSNAGSAEGYRRIFAIRSLPGNRRYHLVFEIDPGENPHPVARSKMESSDIEKMELNLREARERKRHSSAKYEGDEQ